MRLVPLTLHDPTAQIRRAQLLPLLLILILIKFPLAVRVVVRSEEHAFVLLVQDLGLLCVIELCFLGLQALVCMDVPAVGVGFEGLDVAWLVGAYFFDGCVHFGGFRALGVVGQVLRWRRARGKGHGLDRSWGRDARARARNRLRGWKGLHFILRAGAAVAGIGADLSAGVATL